jgi:hypothetical protein
MQVLRRLSPAKFFSCIGALVVIWLVLTLLWLSPGLRV